MAWLDLEAEILETFAGYDAGLELDFAEDGGNPGFLFFSPEKKAELDRDRRERLARIRARAPRPLCSYCSAPILRALAGGSRFCSVSCWRGAARARLSEARAEQRAELAATRPPCPGCGGAVTRPGGKRGPLPKYCSPECTDKAAARVTNERRKAARAARVRC